MRFESEWEDKSERKPAWGWIGIKPKLKYSVVHICLYYDGDKSRHFSFISTAIFGPKTKCLFSMFSMNQRSGLWPLNTLKVLKHA